MLIRTCSPESRTACYHPGEHRLLSTDKRPQEARRYSDTFICLMIFFAGGGVSGGVGRGQEMKNWYRGASF